VATTAITSAPTTSARAFPLTYFIIAFAFTGFFWTLAALGARGVIPTLPGLTVIGTFGPLVAAVIVTAQESGRAGLRSLLGRIVHWRVAPVWYGVVLLGPMLLYLVAMALEVALGGQPPSLGALIGALPIVVIYTVYMVIFVALGEEVGWRGYALPALQARYGALLASVILGVLWALWHLPVFFNPDTHYSDLPFVLQVAIQVPLAILFTWVFNSTGGSVLTAILLHAVTNASTRLWNTMPEYSVEPPNAAEAAAQTVHINIMGAIVTGIAAVVVVLVYGPSNLSRRPRQVLVASASVEFQPRVR
jgi:membrane protease YdiL (CAAX protease family)